MKQQFTKIKQLADKAANKAFIRPLHQIPSTIICQDLSTVQIAEQRIELIKLTCEISLKKIQHCLHGKEIAVTTEKRIKKLPEYNLGTSLIEISTKLGSNCLGDTLEETGKIQLKLSTCTIEFEDKVEKYVLQPLMKILNEDMPQIKKLKSNYNKLNENLEVAKQKLNIAVGRNSINDEKLTSVKEDFDEIEGKLEIGRDIYITELYNLISREPEISNYIISFLKFQLDYNSSVSLTLCELLPEIESVYFNSSKPVYGVDLKEHLDSSGRTIAYVIEYCVCALLGHLEEEGIFRMGGSTTKIRKLKSAFDAGLVTFSSLLTEDPHVISNCLKTYLRSLPLPLLSSHLDWNSALKSTNKLIQIKSLLQLIPSINLINLIYILKFLKLIISKSNINKMNKSNIAIVIGPNLLHGDGDELNFSHLSSAIIDTLLSDEFDEIGFEQNFFITIQCHDSDPDSSSADSPKPILRKKNKKAPSIPIINSTDDIQLDENQQQQQQQQSSSIIIPLPPPPPPYITHYRNIKTENIEFDDLKLENQQQQKKPPIPPQPNFKMKNNEKFLHNNIVDDVVDDVVVVDDDVDELYQQQTIIELESNELINELTNLQSPIKNHQLINEQINRPIPAPRSSLQLKPSIKIKPKELINRINDGIIKKETTLNQVEVIDAGALIASTDNQIDTTKLPPPPPRPNLPYIKKKNESTQL